MQLGSSTKMRAYILSALLVAGATITACFGGSEPEPVKAVVVVRMLPASASVKVGSTVNLVASATADDGTPVFNKTYVWASNDTSVVEARAGGVMFGKKVGVTSVTASVDGVKGTTQITVTP